MLRFLKNAFLAGLIILIPLVLLYFAIRELIQALIAVATPIADLFPPETFAPIKDPEILAGLLVIASALLLGTLASIPPVRSGGRWLESKTLGNLPLYRMIKTFVSAFLEMEDTDSFRPAVVLNDSGGAEPCYLIEDNDQPMVVVLVPWSPASFAGSIRIAPREKVLRLDTTFDQFSLSLANFGLGVQSLVANTLSENTKTNPSS